MKFQCRVCDEITDIHRVKFVYISNRLVCKDAMCCDTYMDQVITDEYKGLPDIKRDASDTNHSKGYDADKLWSDTKGDLLNGGLVENE